MKPTRTVLFLNIPSYLSSPEFLRYLGPAVLEEVERMRLLISEEYADSYGALAVFRSEHSAARAVAEFNGEKISALAKELLFVSCVAEEDAEAAKLLWNFKSSASAADLSPKEKLPAAGDVASPTYGGSGAVQCAICQDVESGPLIMTLCGHVFHLKCFARWEKTKEECPLCRFDVQAAIGVAATCSVPGCEAKADELWMCLVCAAVLCGQRPNSHAQQHYAEVDHRYGLEVGGCRVWDFAKESFVHRLITTDSGEFADPRDAGDSKMWWFTDEDDEELQRAAFEVRHEAIAAYYTDLLNDQLRVQRDYYTRQAAAEEESSLAAEEAAGRRRITEEFVAETRRLVGGSRVAALKRTHMLRKQRRAVADEVELAEVRVASLREGLPVVERGIAAAKERRGSSSGSAEGSRKRELLAKLKEENEALMMKLTEE